MENAKRKAVINADFFIKSTHNDEKAEIFLKMMEDLNIQPVMHHYVYEVELRKSIAVKQLVEKNQIEVYQTEEFVTDEKEYREYFLDAYEWFNRFELKEGENIYTYHEEDESLGEIRSLYLAKKKEQKLLLNN